MHDTYATVTVDAMRFITYWTAGPVENMNLTYREDPKPPQPEPEPEPTPEPQPEPAPPPA
jgi:hypothetical protein